MRFKLDSWVLVFSLAFDLACGGGGGKSVSQPVIGIALQPGSASLMAGATQTFTATVTGSSNTGVTWSVQEGPTGGNIDSEGSYTAPAGAGTYHVVATSNADPGKSTSATVTVTALPPRRLSLIAGGTGGEGSADGTGTLAGFSYPRRVAVDASGHVYVADTQNNTIRKITPGGVVTTLAGSVGREGSTDGPGSSALFDSPQGLVVDGGGNVFVADTGNFTIRKITPSGVVTTFAGSPGAFGSADGLGSAARFLGPWSVALGPMGNLYVTDTGNSTIRKITPGGQVSTLAGTPRVSGSADGSGADARFNTPSGIVTDVAGNVYVTDLSNQTLRKITPSGVVSTLAGLAESPGTADGVGSAARFYDPQDLTMDASGNLYVTDRNNTIRKVSPGGEVSTFAGSTGYVGHRDGTGPAAVFNLPSGVALDPGGTLYIADAQNHAIRKISPTAEVSTFAGSPPTFGVADGSGAEARFTHPRGVAVDFAGTTYVADSVNQTIRKITASGEVSVLAGITLFPGYLDGPLATARFNYPEGVAVDGAGTLYVADTSNHVIRKISPAGMVSTLAGAPGAMGTADGTGADARFNFPSGIAVDTSGNVYVADTNNDLIRKVSPSGMVTTLPDAHFNFPTAIAVDAAGNVYVPSDAIWKITPSGQVSILAGGDPRSSQKFQDGMGANAWFWYPSGIAVDASGILYVADWGNHAIRQISPAGVVSTVGGKGGVPGIVLDQAPGGLSRPWGIALAPNGDLVVSTNHAIVRAVKP